MPPLLRASSACSNESGCIDVPTGPEPKRERIFIIMSSTFTIPDSVTGRV